MSDTLDIEQSEDLLNYLVTSGHIHPNEHPQMNNLSGGVSNRTVWVEFPDGKAWVMKQALAKLRVAVDWFSSPERIFREAAGLKWLAEIAPKHTTTPLVFVDQANYILAMEAVPKPHENWKMLLLKGQFSFEQVKQFGEILGTIHREAYRRRDEVQAVFSDRSFFESLRVEPYYSYTASQVSQAAQFLHSLIDETRANTYTLVHGDYSPKNVLVYQGKLVLLDHEVIHWGDPAFDLGFSLTHLLSKAHHVHQKRDDFAQAALLYWNTYIQTLGTVAWAGSLETRVVKHTLACLLARVSGRSPLEYLSNHEREQQRVVVTTLMEKAPLTIPELTEEFVSRL